MEHSTLALVGRYPALIDFLRELLRAAFPHTAIDHGGRLDALATTAPDLLICIHDRGSRLDIDALGRQARRSPWRHGVLILSEQPARLPASLPAGVVVRDLAINPAALLRLIQELSVDRCSMAVPASSRPHPRRFRFTPKERQVLGHLSKGISNKRIAEQMQLSESTIKFHMRKLFAKTGCESRIHMALMAGQWLERPDPR